MSLEDKQLSHGDILRILRRDRGFSLRELGRKTGITASYLSRLENDSRSNMSMTIFSLLCKTLNAHPSLFFDERLQAMLAQPLEVRDFFLVQDVYHNGNALTEEQKIVMIDAALQTI